ncbi:hypothetical protein AI2716V1_4640 [Enterobacter cloacae]|nr:DUF551 domain-containing protein [Enterobacter hormaechei]CAE6397734.1 hypothetical protein AI2716V1_4640 [Enterobacter cloacae]CAH3745017.1 hypothetical protein AI2716V1_4640 [Enterobacter cloacae]HDS3652959.1 DUF551 domain-containing protein [Enterobacter hormaechei subsp. steigerwaltii]
MSNIDKQALRQTAEKAQEHGVFNMDIHSQTVLALLDELESMGVQIANLTAERDALREGEMGDAKHSNTRAAADIYFQLVEECEVPAGGSLVEYVSELRERAAMLQGADVNSPDGWVACSERMPEDGEKVLTSFRGGMRTAVCKVVDVLGHKIFVDELALFNGVPAEYWQPLPAAPHFREILNSSTNNFRENAETSTKCPKCGGRGSYHCPQMLGTVECECTLSAPQEVAIR